MNLMKYLLCAHLLMDKAGGDGGGAGGGGGAPASKDGGGAPTPAAGGSVTLSKEQFDAIMAKIGGGGAPAPTPSDKDKKDGEGDLASKAAKEREEGERRQAETKGLEAAVAFNHGIKEWAKTNAVLLPKSIDSIIAAADKETYDSAVQKSNAIKEALVSEFFAQQSNLDLLTQTQKNALEEFKKLTKNSKQERVQTLFDTVFEPTFESLKRERKASQVRQGLGDPSNMETAHEAKMKAISQKRYFKKGVQTHGS